MNKKSNIAWALLGGLALLAGCRKDDYTLAFSHQVHVTGNGMSCKDCHGAEAKGRFLRPGHDACKDCHGDWIDTKEIGAKTCGVCHKVKDLAALAAQPRPAPAPAAGRVFVHTAALSNRCNDCHGNLLDAKLKSVPELTTRAKVRLRDQAHRWGLDCQACHEKLNPQTPPDNHRQNWTRRHGVLGSQSDNVCGVCHRAETCRECHQVTKPESHNNLWRLKTHGIQAAWDRARCQVCHEQDSCAACHAETRPQSHTAAWRQSHCLACHPSASTGTGCSLCHPADLGSHPNPHPAGFRSQHCNNCHPGSPDTLQCGACHGRDLIGAHPDPHPAGWRSQHCNSCHPGSPEAKQCEVCHGGDLLGNHPNPHAAGWRKKHCFSCHAGAAAQDECAICHPGGGSVLVHQSFWPPVHNRFGDRADCYTCHKP